MEHNHEKHEEVVLEPEEIVNVEPQAPEVVRSGNNYFLPISILLAGVMISGSIIYLVGSKNQGAAAPGAGGNPPAPVATGLPPVGGRDVILGDANAPVTFIEYGDYQCPFCGQFFSQVEPKLRDNYVKTGKVRIVFRSFQFLGPESIAAAQSAECAKDQSKFWAYHDALYGAEVADGHENSGNLTRALFISLAKSVGMDTGAFTSCIDSNKYADQVQKDIDAAQNAAGVNSTPTAFVNGQKMIGALSYDQYAAAIDALLKK
jgi:protein-disulfide isomerase